MPKVASAAVRSKAAVLVLFTCCLLLLPLFMEVLCWALLLCAELCVLLNFAIIPLGMRADERDGCFAFIALLPS